MGPRVGQSQFWHEQRGRQSESEQISPDEIYITYPLSPPSLLRSFQILPIELVCRLPKCKSLDQYLKVWRFMKSSKLEWKHLPGYTAVLVNGNETSEWRQSIPQTFILFPLSCNPKLTLAPNTQSISTRNNSSTSTRRAVAGGLQGSREGAADPASTHPFISPSIHLSTHPFISPSIHPPTQPFTHSPSSTQSVRCPPTYLPTHSLLHSPTHPSSHPQIHQSIHPSIHSPICPSTLQSLHLSNYVLNLVQIIIPPKYPCNYPLLSISTSATQVRATLTSLPATATGSSLLPLLIQFSPNR